ncbi:hypothetical protein ANCCEY_12104 [Ancylostoma ceylanicum]|uniref:Uncharacterized protein n=1 Tax=Ancylostoma ceylanicum TaxID=53326 RepID=A0A0D6LAG9_9BILA|nr:hypothetical protein ANCCEY_12104 [Ancylostoma ceylanicum]
MVRAADVLLDLSELLRYFLHRGGQQDNPLDIFDLRKTYVGQIFANSYLAVDSFFFIAGVLVAFLKFKVCHIYIFSPLLILPFALFGTFVGIAVSVLILLISTDSANRGHSPSITLYTRVRHLKWIEFRPLVHNETEQHLLHIAPEFCCPISGLNIFEVFYFFLPASDFEGGPVDPRMREKYAYSFWIYHMPYIRCQVFIVGLLVGYLLERKKTVRMGQASAFFSHFEKLRKHRLCSRRRSFNMAMWVAAFVSMGLALFGLKDWISGHQWDLFPRAMYSAFGRLFWTAGLSWIVIACHYGYGGTAEVS